VKKLLFLVLAVAGVSPLLADTKTVILGVKGWTCGSCAAATRIALKKLDGVEDVKTDLKSMEATVTYDDAKIAPEKMVRTIERVGYKATIQGGVESAAASSRSAKEAVSDGPTPGERVSFFEVPLKCGAVEGLGCGSATKPILKSIEADPRVSSARINYSGTVLAVVWKDPDQARSGASTVDAAFKKWDFETAPVRGTAREKALKEFDSGQWFGVGEVDRLSQREARVIAARLVNRAKAHFDLPPEKLATLTNDLSEVIAKILIDDTGGDFHTDLVEGVTRIAGKHLNPRQLAEIRKAAEDGPAALPGEAKR
jgi:copper chaperone CopZ